MNGVSTSFYGNLVDDPELRYTVSGTASVQIRVASHGRRRDGGTWVDTDPTFLTAHAWGGLAENIAESLTRGARVVVVGRLQRRSYQTKEGEKRTVYQVEIDAIGPDLTFATAELTKTNRPNTSTSIDPDETWPVPADVPHPEALVRG